MGDARHHGFYEHHLMTWMIWGTKLGAPPIQTQEAGAAPFWYIVL